MFLKYLISLLYLTHRGTLTLLSPPVNVTVESVNLQSELSWSSVTNTENVWYRVEFRENRELFGSNKGSSDHDDWLEILNNTKSRRCNLTFDVFINATLRVRAEDGEQISPWSLSRPFKAVDQSLFGPPNVTLWPRPEKGRLDVRIRDPVDRQYFANKLKYKLFYKKATDSNWTIHSETLSSASIENLEAGLNYCVQARYVWRRKLRPNSIPSTPKCAIISESENSRTIRTVWVTALIIVLTFGLLLMCFFMVNRNYNKFKQALQPPLRMPEHLHKFLSGEEPFLQPPVSSSSSSSSEEEPFDKISLVTILDQGGGGGEINLNT